MTKVPDGKRRGSEFRSGTQKKAALAAEGLSRKDAAEFEKIATSKKKRASRLRGA